MSGDWIAWRGGVSPLEHGVLHYRRYRDGEESPDPVQNESLKGARSCIWSHDGATPHCDIIAYRLAAKVHSTSPSLAGGGE